MLRILWTDSGSIVYAAYAMAGLRLHSERSVHYGRCAAGICDGFGTTHIHEAGTDCFFRNLPAFRLLFFAYGNAQQIVILHLGLWRKARVCCLFTKRCSTNHSFQNQIQVLALARGWRFESSFRHNKLRVRNALGFPLVRTLARTPNTFVQAPACPLFFFIG